MVVVLFTCCIAKVLDALTAFAKANATDLIVSGAGSQPRTAGHHMVNAVAGLDWIPVTPLVAEGLEVEFKGST